MFTDPQALYLNNPMTLEFQAEVQECWQMEKDRFGILLDRSYFYPTGGGQEHDTGTLGKARVLNVIKDAQTKRLIHVVDQDLPPGPVTGVIDAERRLRHMQHHTAQHLLTHCFIELFDLETLSANINGYNPSTLDLPAANLSSEQLMLTEKRANQVIYEDRVVRSFLVSPEQIAHLPLRRAPKVTENIRLVEIDALDYTPCGGTHCLSTGQIGVIKIIKTEKQNDRTRVHFVAGWQALELFQSSFTITSDLAAGLSVGQTDLVATVQRMAEQLQKAQKELRLLQLERMTSEANQITETAEVINGRRVSLVVYQDRSVNEIRMLGTEITNQAGLVAILAAINGTKLSLVVGCGEGAGVSARELLARLLMPFNGRGGGDAHLAQGGGAAVDAAESERLLRGVLAEF